MDLEYVGNGYGWWCSQCVLCFFVFHLSPHPFIVIALALFRSSRSSSTMLPITMHARIRTCTPFLSATVLGLLYETVHPARDAQSQGFAHSLLCWVVTWDCCGLRARACSIVRSLRFLRDFSFLFSDFDFDDCVVVSSPLAFISANVDHSRSVFRYVRSLTLAHVAHLIILPGPFLQSSF